jgi:phosphatidylserine/phosphatidylglycerophosphate/cardiolipin synthase-like enzyme
LSGSNRWAFAARSFSTRGDTVTSLVERLDRYVGAAIGGAVVAHHRRRLRRCGWVEAFDADANDWARGTPPPRTGCSLELLIDGEEALPRIAAELEKAGSHIHIAGWHFSPQFALTRDEEPKILRNLLAELAARVDVHLLAWAGAPLPLFRPSRSMVRAMRDRLCAGTRIQCALDARERPMHCHHEKTIVIDDRVAFVGGIDLTCENGDRFDRNTHVARASVGWHDASARIEGPAVADVAEHFRMRWREVTNEKLPPISPATKAGDVEAQIVRTVPERIYGSLPRGDFRILESHIGALRGARELIYLENQFLWSPEIATILRDKLLRPPSDQFRVLVVLPVRPNTGTDDTRGTLGELVEADDGSGRFLACTLYARHGALADPVYVHAKIGIVDDTWLTVGSANLNDHSLFNDTEMNVVTRDSKLALETRLRLWAEHLELPRDEIAAEPARVIEEHWKPISAEQLARLKCGEPLTHRLVRLPQVSRRSARVLGPVQGLLVDG